MNTQTLINEAISLPVEQRTLVVESLLASLNQPDKSIGKQWLEVAENRLLEMKNGTGQTYDGEEVFKETFEKF